MVRGKILTPQIDPRSLMSEELLMLAVLEQAFSDLESGCPAVRADAEAYFLAYDADSSAFSLDAVCAQFHLSSSADPGRGAPASEAAPPRKGEAAPPGGLTRHGPGAVIRRTRPSARQDALVPQPA